MEKSYINNILNFADENINTAQNLIITKEEAKEIIKELNKNYIPKKIVKIKMEELNNDIKNGDEIEAIFKIKQQQILEELLEDK